MNTIKGRVWVLTDDQGALIPNIDTDMIFHNRYLHITKLEEMGPYALDNLAGWEDFAKKCQPGDIVVAGGNFGCGSSRQQAVDCFRALGVTALVAESFGAIYFRNAVNAGWPVLVCPALDPAALNSGDEIELDLAGGTWRNLTRGTDLPALKAVSNVQREIMAAGGLFKLATG
ncbi:3-isopropylmalate dehydratase [bacterium]|nr:3-isopropylmalate dehydratase [bacterium]